MWQHWRHWASTWRTIFLTIKSFLVQRLRSNACWSSLVLTSISTVALSFPSLPEEITLAEWSHIQTSIKDFSFHWKFSNKHIRHLLSSSWSSTVHYHCWWQRWVPRILLEDLLSQELSTFLSWISSLLRFF